MQAPRLIVSTVLFSMIATGCGLFKKKDDDSSGNPTCSQGNVKSIERPVIPGDEKSGKFTYRYQVDMPPTADAPLLVYIPGGPGQSGFDSPGTRSGYPSTFGVMRTDPRGVACNYAGDSQPQAFYNSEYVADDILAAIKATGVKKFIIYGISYGTVVATIAGSKAEASGLDTPKAVVLEGILPEQIKYTDDYYAKYWDEVLARQSSSIKSKFKSGNYPYWEKDEWADLIQTFLMIGVIQSKSGENVHLLDKLLAYADNPTKSEKAKISDWLSTFDRGGSSEKEDDVPGTKQFYYEIACAEIWKKVDGLTLSFDKFGSAGRDMCSEIEAKGYKFADRPFDAAQWKIKAPIYYFQGKKDPATPYEHSVKHVDKQSNAGSKSYMALDRGGHNPFEAQFNRCSDKIWNAIASGPSDFKKELQNCDAPGLNLAEYDTTKQTYTATLNPDSDSKYADREAGSLDIDSDMVRALIKKVRFRVPK